jgi:K+ transporter
MGAVLALVVAFQSSAKLAFAFGMEVTGTIAITTILFLSPIDNTRHLLLPLQGRAKDRQLSGNAPLAQAPLPSHRAVGAEPADSFRLPRERTITIGSEIEF